MSLKEEREIKSLGTMNESSSENGYKCFLSKTVIFLSLRKYCNKYIVSGKNAKDFKIKIIILRFQTQMKIFLWPSPH